MTVYSKVFVFSLFIIAVVFFYSWTNSLEDEYIEVYTSSEESKAEIKGRLSDSGIWYRDGPNRLAIVIRLSDSKRVEEIGKEVEYKFIHPGVSFSPASDEILNCLIRELDENGINYTLRKAGNDYYITPFGAKIEDYLLNCP